jgi:hypothetical protein
MSEPIRRQLFAGTFPVYSFMYPLRPFMRLNGVSLPEVEEFVRAVGGHGLSVREIEQLAHGFFRGPESFRHEIRQGNLALPLARMRHAREDPQAHAVPLHAFLGEKHLDNQGGSRRAYQDNRGS